MSRKETMATIINMHSGDEQKIRRDVEAWANGELGGEGASGAQ